MSMTLGIKLQADGREARAEIVGVQDSLGRLHTTASMPMDTGLQALEAAARQASSAVPDLGRELQQLGGAGGAGGAALATAAAEVDLLRSKFDPAFASAQRLTAQQHELKRALDVGAISQQRYADLMGQATRASQSAGVSLGQITQATRQLPMQMQDVIVSLQGGMSPLTVLLQQGSQIAGSYGSVGLALKSVTSYVLGMVNPLTVAAAAVAALGLAYYQGSKEADAYRVALLSTGNAAGTSTAQMADMARGMGSAWGVTQGAAAEALAAMASTGRVGSASLREYSQVAIDMEKSFGVSIADTAKHFSELGKDPVGASARLNESMNYLTASTYAQIKAAADNGDAAKAAALAQDAYAQAMKGRAAEVVANLGYMERAWAGIKNAAKETWDAMLGVGRPSTPGDALAKATKQLADREASLKEYGNRGGLFGDDTATQVAKLKDQVYGLQELERMQKRAGTAAAERAAAEKAGIAAIDAVAKANEKGVPKQEQMAKALKDYRENLALAEKAGAKYSAEQIKNAEAAIREQFKVAPPKKTEAETLEKQQAKAYAELVSAMQSKVDAARLEAAQTEKLTESQKQQLAIEKLVKDGKISARDASSAKTVALLAEMKAAEDLKRTEAFRKAQADADEKAQESLHKEVEALRKASAAMALHNAEIGLSTEQLHALRLARLDGEIAVQAGIVAEYDEARARGEVTAQMQLQINKLTELQKKRGLTAEGQQAQVSADADKKATDAAKKAAEKAMADFNALTGQLDASKLNGLFNGAIDGAMKFVTALQLVGDVQDKSAAAHRANLVANGRDVVKFGEVQKQIAAQSAVATLSGYAAMAGALKGYAKEGSRTYAALQNAERVFQAFQLATTLATMAEKTGLMAAFVGAKVAGDAAMQTSGQAAGWAEIAMTWLVAKAKAILGIANQAGGDPYSAFPRIAAMTALMAGLGLLVSGGGGGGAAPTNDGTGTVLGDPDAKSASITNSIDRLRDVQDVALVYTRSMAQSLRNLESNIHGFADVYARVGGVSSLTSGIATGKSDTGLSSALKNPWLSSLGMVATAVPFVGKLVTSLFGKKTTITGSGIGGDAQSFGQVTASGFNGYSYADVNTKKKFFGVTTSDRTREQRGALDSAMEGQITDIFRSIGESLGTGLELLGVSAEEAKRRLDSYVINLGRVDLKGLKGDELNEALTAVFGAEADKFAKFAFGGFEGLAKAGEGYYETFVRVAQQFELVGTYTDRLGHSFETTVEKGRGLTGVSDKYRKIIANAPEDLAKLADAYVKAFGGAAQYQASMDEYYKTFYSEEERLINARREFGAAMKKLGKDVPDSMQSFRDMVTEASKDTSEAGIKLYAALIKLSPAFAEITESTEALAKSIASERLALENQLLELQGNTAELRRREREQLDASNRALYDKIKAEEDAREAQARYTEALQNARSALQSAQQAVASAQSGVDAIRAQGTSNYLAALQQVQTVQEQMAEQARQTASTYRDLARSLREYVDGVVVPPSDAFAKALTKALAGDAKAMAQLPSLASTATSGARSEAGSAAEFRLQEGRILAGVAAAAAAAAALGVESPEQAAQTLQKKLADAQAKLAEALSAANAIQAPLVSNQQTLIAQYKQALAQLATAQAAAAAAQKALDAIAGNTATTAQATTATGQATERVEGEIKKLGVTISVGGLVRFDPADPIRSVFDNISRTNGLLSAQFVQWLSLQSGSLVKLDEKLGTVTVSAIRGFETATNRAAGDANFPGLYVLQYDATNYLEEIRDAMASVRASTAGTQQALHNLAFGSWSMLIRGFGDHQAVPISFRREISSTQFFATGAAFSHGVVSRPTAFDVGVMGEAGPEAIMPLTNVGGGLGVRALMPDSGALLRLVQDLAAQVVSLRHEARASAVAAQEHLQLMRRLTRGGHSVPVVGVPQEPLVVEAAA